jgi:FixJ family two-component response regulator
VPSLDYATRALGDLGGSGGVGYLFKDRTSRDSLKEAVLRVAAGRVVVDPIFSQQAAQEYRDRHSGAQNFSDREVEVLDLLVRGLTNKEIAETMHLLPSETDAEAHGAARRDNRRVLTVLEWLRRTGRLN